MTHIGLEHSDYIVYVDESGDRSLSSIDEGYPVFVLSFCVFQKTHYSHVIIPFVRNKFINLTRRQHKFLCLERATIADRQGASEDQKKGYSMEALQNQAISALETLRESA